ncbi:MAG: hypothetical protein RPU61_03400 [Candidatus Sedimenticola sp. (ex Thyasira tokunagai)]
MDINITLSTTDIVAWWGAIIATIILVWDVYKWKTSGAKIRYFVSSEMKLFGGIEDNDKTYITFRVANIGDRPTTITTIGGKYYKSLWRKLTNKVDQAFVIPSPAFNHQVLPYVLEVGQEWMGGAEQTEDIEEMAKSGYLIIEVYDSVHKKPSSDRVIIRD